ncbi:hypothetical protein AB0467_12925 [Streptomyces sp. NPDC052095]|uniref:hypothetical protein n=1 Tax=unclassified Streptomyces TaxID=2593676 RepID=UPI00344BC9C1
MMRHVKLSAVLIAVVLALTGFSTSGHGRGGSGKSKSHGSSSSGGGCSNSKKSNNGYRSGYDDDDDYGSSSGSSDNTDYATETPSPTTTGEPLVSVVRCAGPGKSTGRRKGKAVTFSTVSLTTATTGSHSYEIEVDFLDAQGRTVDTGTAYQDAAGGDVVQIDVRMDHPGKAAQVRKCRADAEMTY